MYVFSINKFNYELLDATINWVKSNGKLSSPTRLKPFLPFSFEIKAAFIAVYDAVGFDDIFVVMKCKSELYSKQKLITKSKIDQRFSLKLSTH